MQCFGSDHRPIPLPCSKPPSSSSRLPACLQNLSTMSSSSQPASSPPSDVLAIDVNNLTFKYNDELALEDITMNVEQGERSVLLYVPSVISVDLGSELELIVPCLSSRILVIGANGGWFLGLPSFSSPRIRDRLPNVPLSSQPESPPSFESLPESV